MRKIIITIILVFIFSVSVNAESNYQKQYENIGAEQIKDSLDEQTQDFFLENNIDVKNPDWVNQLTSSNVLSYVWGLLTGGINAPLKVAVMMAGIILISASFTAFASRPHFQTAMYATVIAIGALITNNIWQCVEMTVSAVKGCCAFMIAFIPVFASVLALSGKTITAPAMSALLLTASEAVSFASTFMVLPLMGGYLSLSIASGVSPLISNSGIVDGVKKISMWIMSLLGTLFVGILGIQTAVNSAADSVALRTAKFLIGTSVPVAGGVLSEAVSTISASIGLLRSSIGIYGVVALAITLLPIVVELILWRLALMVNISLAGMFSITKLSDILRAVDTMLSVLLAVVLIVGAMFIISLSVVVVSGKT